MTYSRREILIAAAATGAAALAGPAAASGNKVRRWRGTALGARAEIVVALDDSDAAERLVARARHEIERLEAVFSLHRPDSALSRLNRQGHLAPTPFELLDVLAVAWNLHEVTGGRFDPTIQPLWQVYADSYAEGRAPEPAAVRHARSLTGLERVAFGADEIRFGKNGMALTLNGIAQGYITDRVAEMFRSAGLSCVISLGEQRALGSRPDGHPWRAAVTAPDGRTLERVALSDKALATSAPSALRLSATEGRGHILDPGTGETPFPGRIVSVLAERATVADGLSTAFALMDTTAIRTALQRLQGPSALVVDGDRREWLGAD
ncbi:FAD:protein FMN transferase [Ferruginivarius sediminum]|uniref:FAD:protein FMN transferase n=1 Tax=Ferruginivarius sediminum TaxID=2661937 RepID=A0A369T9Q3_9PROT|nr:FAD:protein FMN transferase [Ferruginivarius sediminum]RDD62059.1 FAD:protein FMN transferase [Ferruginivarius sediminum]